MENKTEVPQMDLWKHELEKIAIQITYKRLIAIFVLSAFFIMGVGYGSWWKHQERERAQNYGYNSAMAEYPGAGFAQSGITFCFDQGNYYRSKKTGTYSFLITKDQSVPKIAKEESWNKK